MRVSVGVCVGLDGVSVWGWMVCVCVYVFFRVSVGVCVELEEKCLSVCMHEV